MRVKIPTIYGNHIGLNAMIILEDGSTYRGTGFGYPKTVGGEFVFNTGMVGYTETLTDPSYRGQILCMTYPLVGNYGVPSRSIRDGYGLPKYFESDKMSFFISILFSINEAMLIQSFNVVNAGNKCSFNNCRSR